METEGKSLSNDFAKQAALTKDKIPFNPSKDMLWRG